MVMAQGKNMLRREKPSFQYTDYRIAAIEILLPRSFGGGSCGHILAQ
jgi:hypothetical protein